MSIRVNQRPEISVEACRRLLCAVSTRTTPRSTPTCYSGGPLLYQDPDERGYLSHSLGSSIYYSRMCGKIPRYLSSGFRKVYTCFSASPHVTLRVFPISLVTHAPFSSRCPLANRRMNERIRMHACAGGRGERESNNGDRVGS